MLPIRVESLLKRLGNKEILRSLSFEAPAGKVTAVLGPSGSGKTTLLRLIAGLETPDGGEILLGDELFCSVSRQVFVPPQERNVGMVFQSYALWPHMTIFENIAFPLRTRKRPEDEVRRKVDEAMALVRLHDLGSRRPGEISGGEQQRVALARALIYEPRVLLLDEPLANLDTKVRADIRAEFRRLQKRVGVTTIYVTHDQSEALALADSMVVIDDGKIAQQGDPSTVYRSPSNRFVAEFLGASNVLIGNVSRDKKLDLKNGLVLDCADSLPFNVGAAATVCLRPEDLEFAADGSFRGRVDCVLHAGDSAFYVVDCKGIFIQALATDGLHAAGAAVSLRVKPGRLKAYPA